MNSNGQYLVIEQPAEWLVVETFEYQEALHPRDRGGRWSEADDLEDLSHALWDPEPVLNAADADLTASTWRDGTAHVLHFEGGHKISVLKNPTPGELARWAGDEIGEVRWSADYDSGNYAVWESTQAVHGVMERALGIVDRDPGIANNSDAPVSVRQFATQLRRTLDDAVVLHHLTPEKRAGILAKLNRVQMVYDEALHPRDKGGRWALTAGGEYDGKHVEGGGLWRAPEPSFITMLPREGQTLAAYTDPDGYTVSIVGGVVGGPQMVMNVRRFGTMYITDPQGERVRGGYFMGWPEEEWKIPTNDWLDMSWEARAALEVKQQATAYNPLKQQFEFFKGVDRSKFAYDEAQHPRVASGGEHGGEWTRTEGPARKGEWTRTEGDSTRDWIQSDSGELWVNQDHEGTSALFDNGILGIGVELGQVKGQWAVQTRSTGRSGADIYGAIAFFDTKREAEKEMFDRLMKDGQPPDWDQPWPPPRGPVEELEDDPDEQMEFELDQEIPGLSKPEFYALSMYFESPDALGAADMRRIQRVIERQAPLTKPLVVYRGLTDSEGELKDQLKAGKTWKDKTIGSWTTDKAIALGFASGELGAERGHRDPAGRVLRTTLPKGARVLQAGGVESEVLLPSGLVTTVKGLTRGYVDVVLKQKRKT